MESFLLNLALGGFILSLLLSLFSFVVYFFRLAFLSIAVSHAVLAGLAIGIFLGIDPTLSALIFSLFIGWLIAFLRRKTGLTEDASIGIVLALAMAGGIILIYLSGYQGNLLAFLFGSITTISTTDVAILFVFLVLTAILFKINFQKILFLCFDEESAYSSGVNTGILYYTLVGMLSFIVTFATKLVGVILTHAMLILPTAVAYQIAWHFSDLLLLSGIISLLSTFGGLILAYYTDMPAGPSIILLGGILFITASLWRLKRKKILRRGK
ncbi:MAG TPA: metal ABC transporter permease [Aquificales bacterium]|nr:metal ABC transporter permease [Aquificales bacterium]